MRYTGDPNIVIKLVLVELQEGLTYEEELHHIIDRKEKVLSRGLFLM